MDMEPPSYATPVTTGVLALCNCWTSDLHEGERRTLGDIRWCKKLESFEMCEQKFFFTTACYNIAGDTKRKAMQAHFSSDFRQNMRVQWRQGLPKVRLHRVLF